MCFMKNSLEIEVQNHIIEKLPIIQTEQILCGDGDPTLGWRGRVYQ